MGITGCAPAEDPPLPVMDVRDMEMRGTTTEWANLTSMKLSSVPESMMAPTVRVQSNQERVTSNRAALAVGRERVTQLT